MRGWTTERMAVCIQMVSIHRSIGMLHRLTRSATSKYDETRSFLLIVNMVPPFTSSFSSRMLRLALPYRLQSSVIPMEVILLVAVVDSLLLIGSRPSILNTD